MTRQAMLAEVSRQLRELERARALLIHIWHAHQKDGCLLPYEEARLKQFLLDYQLYPFEEE